MISGARALRKDTAYNACAPPFDGSWQILTSHTVTATPVLEGFARRESASVIACTLDQITCLESASSFPLVT